MPISRYTGLRYASPVNSSLAAWKIILSPFLLSPFLSVGGAVGCPYFALRERKNKGQKPT
jgi:hypothetical protein